ncbi:hypothetical protein HN51_015727 [Arachis hypogaea]
MSLSMPPLPDARVSSIFNCCSGAVSLRQRHSALVPALLLPLLPVATAAFTVLLLLLFRCEFLDWIVNIAEKCKRKKNLNFVEQLSSIRCYCHNGGGHKEWTEEIEYLDESGSILYKGQQTRRNSSLEDWPRIKYLKEYIGSILDMLRNGHDIRGYFVWPFIDVFELLSGYEFTYGLYYINLKDPTLRRQPKLSFVWYSLNSNMDPMVAMQIEKNSSLHDAI